MANAVKMLPFPVTSDSAELTLLWGRDNHGPQFGYRISLMTGQKKPQNQDAKRKSLYFMNIMNDSLSKRAKLGLSKGVIYVGKHLNLSDFFLNQNL